MKHFFSPNSGEDQKKRFSPGMEHLFSPYSSTDLRSDALQSQIIRGDAGEDHTQSVGGIHSKYLGGYIPLPPRFSAPLCATWFFSFPPGIRNGTKYFFLSRQKSLCFCGNRKIYPSSKRPVIWLAFCEKILVNFFLC